jgi:hypothetical protein
MEFDQSKIYKRLNVLIGDTIDKLNNEPDIQEVGDGNVIVQYFKDWVESDDIPNLRYREFHCKCACDHDDDETKLYYLPKGFYIDKMKNADNLKLYCMTGRIIIRLEDDTIIEMDSYDKYTIPANVEYEVKSVINTYILVLSDFPTAPTC